VHLTVILYYVFLSCTNNVGIETIIIRYILTSPHETSLFYMSWIVYIIITPTNLFTLIIFVDILGGYHYTTSVIVIFCNWLRNKYFYRHLQVLKIVVSIVCFRYRKLYECILKYTKIGFINLILNSLSYWLTWLKFLMIDTH